MWLGILPWLLDSHWPHVCSWCADPFLSTYPTLHWRQVASRLALLGSLSGLAPKAVVALTQRCPPLLGVEERLLAPRLEALCAALGRPQEQVSQVHIGAKCNH